MAEKEKKVKKSPNNHQQIYKKYPRNLNSPPKGNIDLKIALNELKSKFHLKIHKK